MWEGNTVDDWSRSVHDCPRGGRFLGGWCWLSVDRLQRGVLCLCRRAVGLALWWRVGIIGKLFSRDHCEDLARTDEAHVCSWRDVSHEIAFRKVPRSTESRVLGDCCGFSDLGCRRLGGGSCLRSPFTSLRWIVVPERLTSSKPICGILNPVFVVDGWSIINRVIWGWIQCLGHIFNVLFWRGSTAENTSDASYINLTSTCRQ